MSGAAAKLLGRWGEAVVAQYLQKRGHTILASGYRSRFGEIDLIAANRTYILFVEVKLRKEGALVSGREAVDHRKQERLRKTALLWLSAHPEELRQPRFDVAEVTAAQGVDTRKPQITYIENAF